MFAIPGIFLILIAIYLRPHEIVGPLGSLPFLHAVFGLAVFGLLIDVRRGITHLRSTPLLPWVVLFMSWAVFTVMLRAPSQAPEHALELAICAALYVLIGHGVQSFRALEVVAAAVIGAVIFVSIVAVEQSVAPTGCIEVDQSAVGDNAAGKYDGRPCEIVQDCYLADAEPGAEYVCEHVGLFGTSTVGKGRVRYRGVLQDPNELALAGAIGLPLGFAFTRSRRRSIARYALLGITFVLILIATMLTGSRTGQVVFLTVLAVPFGQRFGMRGLLLAALLALPLLLLGGRTGTEASLSRVERVDCWAEALSIWRLNPLLGVGLGQFGKYHYLTAHNSYLLALAELGLPGMLVFTAMIYVSIKIPWVAWRSTSRVESPLSDERAAAVVRPWSIGLLAALSGLALGMLFLSFAYHYVLWIYIGLSAAFYSTIKRHAPSFGVPFGKRDLASVGLIAVTMLGVVHLYARQVLG